MRERFFTPRLRFKTYDELNAWLMDKCIAYAKAHSHPERPNQTVWEVFEEERPKLVANRGRFDGFHALPASVSKTCLVRFDNNKYSVSGSSVGRPVEIHAYADRIVIRQDGRIVGEHPRSYGRGETIYDPWHYVPVLARKPGALRDGAPFEDWVLASRSGTGTAQARRVGRWRSPDGCNPCSRTHRWIAGGRICLCPSDVQRRPLVRRDPQHPHAATRPRTGGNHPYPGCADAAACAGPRLRPIRSTLERVIMERTEVRDMMGELKLHGMRNAYDEALAPAVKRKHEPQLFVGDLLKAEISDKQARSIKYHLGSGPIKVLADQVIRLIHMAARGGVAMDDLFLLSEAQMRRIEPLFSAVAWHSQG